MDELNNLISDIRKHGFKPIYFLMGEEPYFIDQASNFIMDNALGEEERAFNQHILYGRDVSLEHIVGYCKQYPMMAERQVVLVREAQTLSRSIEDMVAYAEQPTPTTTLVVCYKFKTIDKRKKLYKALLKNGMVLEAKKLYDNKVPGWISSWCSSKGYQIDPKAGLMLVEFLGADLSKIENELNKLQVILAPGSQITPSIIEENIGISKDYNNFELRKALIEKDMSKALRIVQYFSQNSKENPVVVTISLLYNFFSQLLQYHSLTDKSSKNVSEVLGINPFFVKEYQLAAQLYSMKQASQIISSLRKVDMMSKGMFALNPSHADLLKEIFVKVA